MEGLAIGKQVSVVQRNEEKTQEPIGNPAHQTGKYPGLNNRPAFRRQKGRLITSQRPPSNTVWVKLGLSGLGSGAKVCETPPGIREVEYLLGFFTSKIDQDGEKHK
jgi:hypothetical protein